MKGRGGFPVCIGMERSGSTVTWQTVCLLLEAKVEKTHDYTSDKRDCIYTFRNPVESYISLVDKFSDVYTVALSKSHAIKRLCLQAKTFENLKRDASSGRKVLTIRYEDYYYDPEKRVLDIANFLNVDVSKKSVDQIVSETSIEANLKISNGKNFGVIDSKSGLHGGHINPVTRGEPFRSISSCADIEEILENKKIIELCKVFGYSLNDAGVAQLVERQPSKLNVVGSSPITRSS